MSHHTIELLAKRLRIVDHGPTLFVEAYLFERALDRTFAGDNVFAVSFEAPAPKLKAMSAEDRDAFLRKLIRRHVTERGLSSPGDRPRKLLVH